MTGLDVDDDLAFLALLALQRRGRLNLVGVSVTAGNAALRTRWKRETVSCASRV